MIKSSGRALFLCADARRPERVRAACFADYLNSLAFDRDNFGANVQMYVPHVWPHYLEDAQTTLETAKISQLCDLEFKDWETGGTYRFGAWHHLAFPEFRSMSCWRELQTPKAGWGRSRGSVTWRMTRIRFIACLPMMQLTAITWVLCDLQLVTDEMLEALGISPESAISAIKWQMR